MTIELGPDTAEHAPCELSRDELCAAVAAVAGELEKARQQLAESRVRRDASGVAFWARAATRLERAHAWLFRLFCAAR